ncbi:sulfotransferase family protein [Filimonas effusa]|uniref:Sulfotransferase family protein n=1 Tax=Filimonas effusa TaxID=2508721 RepID=A0A4Q1DBK0_9BACT|nr:sulfotransferase family protein [Filimonas effusa]RXK85963.1 sulfotransferase family protein [Filimonas effusa]
MTTALHQAALAGWIPFKLRNGTEVQWLYTGTQPYTDPFFDETISKCKSFPENNHLKRSASSCDMLEEWSLVGDTLPPSAVIFHVSRCGSTLLAQLMGLDSNNIALAEVPFFDDLLRAKYKPGGKDLSHLLPHAVSFYTQKRRGGEKKAFIKADSWHLFFYDQLRALYPNIPFILLYRRPDEVIASQEKRRGMHAVPGVVENEIFELGELPDYTHPLNTYMAAVLQQYYQKMQQIRAVDDLSYLINYNEGFVAITEKLYELTGTILTPEARQSVAERCSYDAKEPYKKFSSELLDDNAPSEYMEKAFEEYHRLEQLRKKDIINVSL